MNTDPVVICLFCIISNYTIFTVFITIVRVQVHPHPGQNTEQFCSVCYRHNLLKCTKLFHFHTTELKIFMEGPRSQPFSMLKGWDLCPCHENFQVQTRWTHDAASRRTSSCVMTVSTPSSRDGPQRLMYSALIAALTAIYLQP